MPDGLVSRDADGDGDGAVQDGVSAGVYDERDECCGEWVFEVGDGVWVWKGELRERGRRVMMRD